MTTTAALAYLRAEREAICLESGVDLDVARVLADDAVASTMGGPGGDDDAGETLDDVALYTALWRRFMRVAPDEPIELCLFAGKGKRIETAYPSTLDEHVALLREADARQDCAGVYVVFNRIDPRIASHGPRWVATRTRASDAGIRQIRAVYVDIDPKRGIKGTVSATDTEKDAARVALHGVKDCLLSLGIPDQAIATGDSGNGYFLFVALEPVTPSDETTAKAKRLLTLLAHRFNSDSVDIDQSVFNPSRLAPAPGTRKRKGQPTEGRPHRPTSLCVPYEITPIRIGDL